ncbi:pentatricopeptide repeat-containing protein [Acrasis kona]|uniref:Pentatricopeptide repeat-containing protein n=1 Tax=Acrasis kona TaxID=1008807 RepID=A0AAW2ZQ01_9EUKA
MVDSLIFVMLRAGLRTRTLLHGIHQHRVLHNLENNIFKTTSIEQQSKALGVASFDHEAEMDKIITSEIENNTVDRPKQLRTEFLDSLLRKYETERIDMIWRELEGSLHSYGPIELTVIYNFFILRFWVNHFHDKAIALFEEMRQPSSIFKPNIYTFTVMIQMYFRYGKYQPGWKLFNELMKSETHIDQTLFSVILQHFFETEQTEEYLTLYQRFTKNGLLRPTIFELTNLMRVYLQMGQYDTAIRVMDQMHEIMTVDGYAIIHCIKGLIKADLMDMASDVIYKMHAVYKVKPTNVFLSVLCTEMVKRERVKRALQLYYYYVEEKKIKPNGMTCMTLFSAIFKQKEYETAIKLYNHVTHFGKMDSVFYAYIMITFYRHYLPGLAKRVMKDIKNAGITLQHREVDAAFLGTHPRFKYDILSQMFDDFTELGINYDEWLEWYGFMNREVFRRQMLAEFNNRQENQNETPEMEHSSERQMEEVDNFGLLEEEIRRQQEEEIDDDNWEDEIFDIDLKINKNK